MKITSSANYHHEYDNCNWNPCDRFYCHKHRYLYRLCDTEYNSGEIASWEDGGSKSWKETTGDCPNCSDDFNRRKRQERSKEEMKKGGKFMKTALILLSLIPARLRMPMEPPEMPLECPKASVCPLDIHVEHKPVKIAKEGVHE